MSRHGREGTIPHPASRQTFSHSSFGQIPAWLPFLGSPHLCFPPSVVFGGPVGFPTSFSPLELEKDFGVSHLGTGLDPLSPPPTCAGETLPDFGPGPPETSERQTPEWNPMGKKGSILCGVRGCVGIWNGGLGCRFRQELLELCRMLGLRETGEVSEPRSCGSVCRFGACSGAAAGLSHIPRRVP